MHRSSPNLRGCDTDPCRSHTKSLRSARHEKSHSTEWTPAEPAEIVNLMKLTGSAHLSYLNYLSYFVNLRDLRSLVHLRNSTHLTHLTHLEIPQKGSMTLSALHLRSVRSPLRRPSHSFLNVHRFLHSLTNSVNLTNLMNLTNSQNRLPHPRAEFLQASDRLPPAHARSQPHLLCPLPKNRLPVRSLLSKFSSSPPHCPQAPQTRALPPSVASCGNCSP